MTTNLHLRFFFCGIFIYPKYYYNIFYEQAIFNRIALRGFLLKSVCSKCGSDSQFRQSSEGLTPFVESFYEHLLLLLDTKYFECIFNKLFKKIYTTLLGNMAKTS